MFSTEVLSVVLKQGCTNRAEELAVVLTHYAGAQRETLQSAVVEELFSSFTCRNTTK